MQNCLAIVVKTEAQASISLHQICYCLLGISKSGQDNDVCKGEKTAHVHEIDSDCEFYDFHLNSYQDKKQ